MLTINQCKINTQFLTKIFSKLNKSPEINLKYLNLADNNLQGQDICKLFQLLQNFSTLHTIDISYNNID